jgi:hypothetical protein
MPEHKKPKAKDEAAPAKFQPEDAAYGVPGRDKPGDLAEPPVPVGPDDQAGGPVTGAENIERQQTDPDLKDNSGARP